MALLFYAGHGLQYRGKNYLVTIDARLANAFALARETYPFDDIMEAMRSSARISLLFFDACRNNPLAERLKRFADFNKHALKPAVAEINQIAGYVVTIGAIRRGRTVERLHLLWLKKDPAALREAAAERARPRVGRAARRKGRIEVVAS